MASLIDEIAAEAVQLGDQDLPSAEQVRPFVGAVIKRLERLETEVVGEVKPAPEPEAPHVPTELELAEQDLAAAQAKVAALQSSDSAPAQS